VLMKEKISVGKELPLPLEELMARTKHKAFGSLRPVGLREIVVTAAVSTKDWDYITRLCVGGYSMDYSQLIPMELFWIFYKLRLMGKGLAGIENERDRAAFVRACTK
jgi:hypothetical protein